MSHRFFRLTRHGFSLLELSVVLVVVAIVVAFALQALQSNTNAACYTSTRMKAREIQAALDQYAANNGRFPRPAPRNLTPTQPAFGVEVATSLDPNIDRTVDASPALIGAVPVSTLGLSANYAGDCWNNKFTYAVTENLAKTTTDYAANLGGLTVKAGTLGSASVTTLAAYALVSHGEQALGATPVNYNATTRRNCNTVELNAAISRIDKENCDTLNNTFYTADMNTGSDSAQFFDDVILYSDKVSYTTNCPAQAVSWGTDNNCSGTVSAASNGTSNSVVTGTTNGAYSGSATATCANGVWTVSGSCNLKSGSCTSRSVDWLTNCHNTSPPLANGASSKPLGNMNTNGYRGSVVVTCSNGNLSQSDARCVNAGGCAAGSISWSGCSATLPALGDGDTMFVTNSAAGRNGTVKVACNGTTLSKSDATCDTMADCSAQSINWGAGCSATSGSMVHGGTAALSNTSAGFTGSTTITCTDGTATASGGNCVAANANCTSQTVTWGSGCSATANALTHGATANVTNNASNRTGTATVTCNNGTATASGTCDLGCADQTVSWSTYCSGTYTASPHGSTVSVSNSTSNYTGNVNATCSQGVVSLTAATCAKIELGGIPYCWGQNTYGVLGIGSQSAQQTTPAATILPAGTTKFKTLELGGGADGHGCAIGSDDKAYCWGINSTGQLGDGTTTLSNKPKLVTAMASGVTSYSAITVGGYHTCGIGNNNVTYCWGRGDYGQIGNGNTVFVNGENVDSYTLTPMRVDLPSGVTRFTSIKASIWNTCAIGDNNRAYCWGYNNSGQSGNNDLSQSLQTSPSNTPITLPSGVTSLSLPSCGESMCCALGNNSQAYCWGSNSSYGMGGSTSSTTPVAVTLPSGVTGYTNIGVGSYHACAITTTGTAYCWGQGTSGQLGNNATTSSNTPVPVTMPPSTAFTSVQAGFAHTCAVDSTKKVWCWGEGLDGRLGIGSVASYSVPKLVNGDYSKVAIGAGNTYSCALKPAPCGAQSVSWGGGCTATLGGSIPSGSSVTVNSSNSGFAGSITLACDSEVLTQSNPTCNAYTGAQPSCTLTATPTASFTASPTDVLGCGGAC